MVMKEGDIMPVGENNQQITVVLPKLIVEKLDKLADKEVRTRSQQAAKIIIDYFKNYEESLGKM
jgi:metal-responsive CopG/Arc/MetJ family transcriptional regulator